MSRSPAQKAERIRELDLVLDQVPFGQSREALNISIGYLSGAASRKTLDGLIELLKKRYSPKPEGLPEGAR